VEIALRPGTDHGMMLGSSTDGGNGDGDVMRKMNTLVMTPNHGR